MDATSCLLAAIAADLTVRADAGIVIKAYWLNQFRSPDAILGNKAFNIIAL